MIVANGAGGSPAETLFFAVPLIVLGIALFVQKKTAPVVPLVLVGLGILFAVGSFTFLNGGHSAYGEMFHALCDARDADSAEAATTTFENEVHGPLHDFADALTEEDRAVAALVLVSKQEVEALIDVEKDPRPALDGLTGAVQEGLPVLEEEELSCADS